MAEVGCPVVFTDRRDFLGHHRCMDIGRYPDASFSAEEDGSVDFAQDVLSYEIRRGYKVQAFNEKNFQGDLIINKRGPTKYVAHNRKKGMLKVRSLIVSIA